MTRRNSRRHKKSVEELLLSLALAPAAVVAFAQAPRLGSMFWGFAVTYLIAATLGFVAIHFYRHRDQHASTSDTTTWRQRLPSRSRPPTATPGSTEHCTSDIRTPEPPGITVEKLRKMDWLGFEHLVLEVFRGHGFDVRKTGAGADGGVDIELHDSKAAPGMSLHSVIQCKARGNASIGVDKVRELLGVVTAKRVRRGILICNTAYTPDAKAFAQENPGVVLADLEWVFKQVQKADEAKRAAWESRFFGQDYDVPSCPACEIKLAHRTSRRGDFWGCRNYPRGCKTTIWIRGDLR